MFPVQIRVEMDVGKVSICNNRLQNALTKNMFFLTSCYEEKEYGAEVIV